MSTTVLDPDAPAFIPPVKTLVRESLETITPMSTPSPPVKEPQCSRYSRRTARHEASPNTPRAILGSKIRSPRPILGRKEEPLRDEADEYIGKEYRNMNRNGQRAKMREQANTNNYFFKAKEASMD